MKKKIALYVILNITLIVVILCFIHIDRQFCMNVPVVSENRFEKLKEITTLDISELTFNDEDVAVDFPSNSIYISQSFERLSYFYDLQGKLKVSNPEYTLFFLDTPEMENIQDSVRNGKPLTLLIKCGDSYQKVNLVIITLPILYLDYEYTAEDDEGREINNGKMSLWEDRWTTTCSAEWRLRGNSTRTYPKKAWKLNLRKENGENENKDLLGLGSDDDWILNPMSMDDTKIKERLSQELWNQLASETDYNYQMSRGEYVEVIINGAYQGIYMLQRRVDTKYLNLDEEEDILLKGVNTWEADTISEGYEIVSSPYDNEETYIHLKKALNFQDENGMNINNFIDVQLLLQFLSGADNYGYKNMFYALLKTNEAYEMYLIPWDTDLSLGVTWGYDYEESLNEIIERQELETIRKQIPDVDEQIARRWHELRKNIYSEENIFKIMESIVSEVSASGAIDRDQRCWGLLHEGEDNLGNLQSFIKERLEFLDRYYSY